MNTNKLAVFHMEDAKKIFDKLANFYDKDIIVAWAKRAINDINELFSKYNIITFFLNKNSYMGIVMECLSLDYGELYIKIVPPMIERFNTEINTLRLLPKELICKIYEIDISKNAIIMEKIKPGHLAEFFPNREKYKNLFDKIYHSKVDLNTLDVEFKSFEDVVKHDYEICVKNNKVDETVNILYNNFKKIYTQNFSNQVQFLLHGDVYKNNVITSTDGLKIIDPLGFTGPFVMELVSICAYEMLYNEMDNKKILREFIDFFKNCTSEEEYKKALFCQLVKVYIPSLFEANDGGIRASKWLKIIKELYPEYVRGIF